MLRFKGQEQVKEVVDKLEYQIDGQSISNLVIAEVKGLIVKYGCKFHKDGNVANETVEIVGKRALRTFEPANLLSR